MFEAIPGPRPSLYPEPPRSLRPPAPEDRRSEAYPRLGMNNKRNNLWISSGIAADLANSFLHRWG